MEIWCQKLCFCFKIKINNNAEVSMRIKLSNVYLEDQDKALKFYTEVLGFVKNKEIPLREFK